MTLSKKTNRNYIKNQVFNWFSTRGLKVEAVIYDGEDEYLFEMYDFGFKEEKGFSSEYSPFHWALLSINGKGYRHESYENKKENHHKYKQLVEEFARSKDLYSLNKELFDKYDEFIGKQKKTFIVEMHYASATEGGLSVTFVNPKTKEVINISNIDSYSSRCNGLYIHVMDGLDDYPTNKSDDTIYKRKATKLVNDFNLKQRQLDFEKVNNAYFKLNRESLNPFEEKSEDFTKSIAKLYEKRNEIDFIKEMHKLVEIEMKNNPNLYMTMERELEKFCKLSHKHAAILKQIDDLPENLKDFISDDNNLFENESNISYI